MNYLWLLLTILITNSVDGRHIFQLDTWELEDQEIPKNPNEKSLFLTPLLEDLTMTHMDIQPLSLIKHPSLEFEGYSGFFTVDKKFDSNMFFAFVRVSFFLLIFRSRDFDGGV
jgi:hypothetical protein